MEEDQRPHAQDDICRPQPPQGLTGLLIRWASGVIVGVEGAGGLGVEERCVFRDRRGAWEAAMVNMAAVGDVNSHDMMVVSVLSAALEAATVCGVRGRTFP